MSPSGIQVVGEIRDCFELGTRMTISGKVNPLLLGEAVHSFFAADRITLDRGSRTNLAAEVFQHWGIPGLLAPAELVAAADSLYAWINRQWPEATLHREWPVERKLDTGTVLRGVADLVIETEDGFAVIDHKSFPGNRTKAREHASGFAGQLGAYVEAIGLATGKKSLGGYIHIPVSGLFCSVSAN